MAFKTVECVVHFDLVRILWLTHNKTHLPARYANGSQVIMLMALADKGK